MKPAIMIRSFIVVFALAIPSFGQIKLMPLPSRPVKTVKKTDQPHARIQNDALSLPFWDDFSFSPDHRPLDSLWQNSDGVYIGDGIAQNPPSLGAATLDGINAQGQGYSSTSFGPTDALTSCPIDLSTLTTDDNVYISFFYQYGGNGERPEETDSLRLEALSIAGGDTTWVSVWPRGSDLNRSGDFTQALVMLSGDSLFHSTFQFKFQAYGRPKGFFDVWNIDYVYVNKNRSPEDDNYPDRTIASPISSIFGEFYAIPAEHFNDSMVVNPTFKMTSVDNPSDERQTYTTFFGVSYTVWNDSLSSVTTKTDTLDGVFSIRAPDIQENTLNTLVRLLEIKEKPDSAFIDMKTYINANDNLLSSDYDPKYIPIDFRKNDTTHSTFVIKDYYAYDDGTAELAAGLSFSGNQLAIRYPFMPALPDSLTAVDMYFPLGQIEPAGKSIRLTIWDKGDDNGPGEVIYGQNIILERDSMPNRFVRYPLSSPVALADTFFLGYRQNTNGVIGVGYDMSNNTNSNVFFNVGETWQQTAAEELKGSFMIRPVFGESVPDSLVTSLQDEFGPLKLFPNPTAGKFNVTGDFNELHVYNLLGHHLIALRKKEEETVVDLSPWPAGIYIIRILNGSTSTTRKIIRQ